MAPNSSSAFRRAPALLPTSPPTLRASTTTSSSPSPAGRWTAAIRDRLDSGLPAAAVSVFAAMLRAGTRPDGYTLPLLNRAAASLPARRGEAGLVGAAHSVGVRAGFAADIYFCNTLLDAYARRGMAARAGKVFDGMPARDVVSWTSLVSAHAGVGDVREASRLFSGMRVDDCAPSAVTLAVVLRACTAKEDIAGGRQLHCYAVKSGLSDDLLVINSILTHLCRMHALNDAVALFEQSPRRDAVSWNIMISEYSSEGNICKVTDMYHRMRTEEVCPSCQTLTTVVGTFSKYKCLPEGEKLHSLAIRSGLSDAILVASFVDFYAKCGRLDSSVQLFEEFSETGSCIWSAMNWGFIYCGQFTEVIHLFGRMLKSPFTPSVDMLQGLIISYKELGALRLGKATHGYMIRNNYDAQSDNSALETSIVKLYASCGSINFAQRQFDSIDKKDIVAWSSMIEAYAIHGYAMEALALFHRMVDEGVRPNGVTFLNLLSACSHSGLVSEARKLDGALQVISDMNVMPDGRIWGALLASCRTHSNSKLASYAAEKLMELEPGNVGYHVVFSNAQAGSDRWDEVESIRSSMVEMDLQKLPAWTCVAETGSP
ncbi:pentatricopeptide repeat-containing protein DOT4, chloroplastic-like [Oryza brachyantha]|uniref:pentatricopeptide repeat-containing protein DOT4, chloroplastic-like n=1 Tax=Oryza brachyantha TaxID=4533 RepID=UPI001AD9A725|nr:pentatricopeptide repeat-containing protein DOT4, chloroplastic-like [Oryza brachyantha]